MLGVRALRQIIKILYLTLISNYDNQIYYLYNAVNPKYKIVEVLGI